MTQLMRLALAGLFVVAAACSARADEIKLLTAGAYKPVLAELVPSFEKQSGHHVTIANDTAGALVRRINGGEAFDLVILSQEALEKMLGDRKIVDDSITPLAKVGIGVAVRLGAATPDISTAEAFRRTLLAARAVAYVDPASGGTSGIYLTQLFQRLGILSQIRQKSVLVVGGLAAQRVGSNEADIALQQASELLTVPGVRFVGPIPDVLQNYTTYCAAVGLRAKDSTAVTELIAWLASNELAPLLRAKGMDLP
jgi:molybdate transport system substrate-binding protein